MVLQNMARKKLNRAPLSRQVADNLAETIQNGQFDPGDTLPSEIQLAAEYGVSRPVIREALKTLEGEGLIAIAVGKQATVKPISSDILHSFFERAMAFDRASIRDLIEIRIGLEIQSASLAARRHTVDELQAMQASVKIMRQHLQNLDAYAEHDANLHLLIARASHNRMIYFLLESIRDSVTTTIREGLHKRASVAEYEQIQKRHEQLIEVIASRDEQQAQETMRLHFDDALQAFRFPEDPTSQSESA